MKRVELSWQACYRSYQYDRILYKIVALLRTIKITRANSKTKTYNSDVNGNALDRP